MDDSSRIAHSTIRPGFVAKNEIVYLLVLSYSNNRLGRAEAFEFEPFLDLKSITGLAAKRFLVFDVRIDHLAGIAIHRASATYQVDRSGTDGLQATCYG